MQNICKIFKMCKCTHVEVRIYTWKTKKKKRKKEQGKEQREKGRETKGKEKGWGRK